MREEKKVTREREREEPRGTQWLPFVSCNGDGGPLSPLCIACLPNISPLDDSCIRISNAVFEGILSLSRAAVGLNFLTG